MSQTINQKNTRNIKRENTPTFYEFCVNILKDEYSTIQWCQEQNLLLNTKKCLECKSDMIIKKAVYRKDKYQWRCKCGRKCSVRYNSWFSQAKLKIRDALLVTLCWYRKMEQQYAMIECGIKSNKTIVDWYNFCREVCDLQLYKERDTCKLGGPGKIVEIDESKFGKKRMYKGKLTDGIWIFGGIERDSNPAKIFLIPVDQRDRETLLPIIENNIIDGTTIISDFWKSYDCLKDSNYLHLKVNHSLNFVDPDTGAHTNTIEGTWNHVKRSLPRYGTRKTFYTSYFNEFLWRRKYEDLGFMEFIKQIAQLFDPTKNWKK